MSCGGDSPPGESVLLGRRPPGEYDPAGDVCLGGSHPRTYVVLEPIISNAVKWQTKYITILELQS